MRADQISIEAIISPRRHAAIMCARRELLRRAIDERIANLWQAAEFLQRDSSTIGRLLV